jgi:hypothetical protein
LDPAGNRIWTVNGFSSSGFGTCLLAVAYGTPPLPTAARLITSSPAAIHRAASW